MMAPQRSHGSNGGRFPSSATLEALQAALRQYLSDPTEDEQVCAALEVLAREAQDRQLRAEDMLVAFKQVWGDLPEVNAIRDTTRQKRLLDHVVKLCIDAYYKP